MSLDIESGNRGALTQSSLAAAIAIADKGPRHLRKIAHSRQYDTEGGSPGSLGSSWHEWGESPREGSDGECHWKGYPQDLPTGGARAHSP
jgi:hypothetical protein